MNNRTLSSRISELEKKQAPTETVIFWKGAPAEKIEAAERSGKRVLILPWLDE